MYSASICSTIDSKASQETSKDVAKQSSITEPFFRKLTTRRVQLVLRILEVFIALVMLVCSICISGMSNAVSAITKITPIVGLLVSMRTIASVRSEDAARAEQAEWLPYLTKTESIDLIIDVNLLAVYVFISYFVGNNYVLAPGTDTRWTSVFHTPNATSRLLLITLLASVLLVALHSLGTITTIYYAIYRRKLEMPPAYKGSLTSKVSESSLRQSKHRYKCSDVSLPPSILFKANGTTAEGTTFQSSPQRYERHNGMLDSSCNARDRLARSTSPSAATPNAAPQSPRRKGYGDLETPEPAARSAKFTERVFSNGSISAAIYDLGFGALSTYGACPPSPPPLERSSPLKTPKVKKGNTRVVSRTGVDLSDGTQVPNAAGRKGWKGIWSRRDVSGKIAEEGRGGVAVS